MDEGDLEELIDNPSLVQLMRTYRKWYDEGLQPTIKTFLYHDNGSMNDLLIKVMETNTEISPNWKEHFEGHIPTREELYKEEVISTLGYLQLRKIKRLIAENQQELEKTTDPDQQIICMQTHQHLKQLESALTQQMGTVIYK